MLLFVSCKKCYECDVNHTTNYYDQGILYKTESYKATTGFNNGLCFNSKKKLQDHINSEEERGNRTVVSGPLSRVFSAEYGTCRVVE